MKTRISQTLSLFIVLLFLAVPIGVQAADGGRLRLSASETTLAVGDQITVDVRVDNAPTIYGADVRLMFDPAILEVVGTEAGAFEPQLIPGDFIPFDKAFVLQNAVVNEDGAVDFALALLNPAPPVSGDGLLLRVVFRARTEGQTMIYISEGLYGTQSGETIAPKLDSLKIKINAQESEGAASRPEGARALLLGGLAGSLLVIGLFVLFVLRRRRVRKTG